MRNGNPHGSECSGLKDLEQNVPTVTMEKASLFVNKIVSSDAVKVSIERALSKSRAVYPYIENLTNSFIVQAGQNCFVKENILAQNLFVD